MRFHAGGVYTYRGFLDAAIEVLKVRYVTESKSVLKVEWVYKNKKRGSFGILETLVIEQKKYENWYRI